MNPIETPDEAMMRRALELARRGWGQTHPNPMVGAVIVEGGKIVAEGWHRAAGEAHAEIACLGALGRAPAAGATLYVTLEPCSTVGRTGACTEAILRSGLKRVVVGAVDPNPAHAGGGLERLREAGVAVRQGVLAEDCADLNLIFNHWIRRGEPLVAMKIATTLDGKFGAASGDSKWVTGEAARADVMRWRLCFPGIVASANTVLRDDPSLTVRMDGRTVCRRRFVLDRRLKTLSTVRVPQVYTDAFAERTTVAHGPEAGAEARRRLSDFGVALWEIPETDGGLDLAAFKARCASAGLVGLYVEPGPELATRLIETGAADYAFVYQAPKFMADGDARGLGRPRATVRMAEARALFGVRHACFGDDHLVRGHLRPPEG